MFPRCTLTYIISRRLGVVHDFNLSVIEFKSGFIFCKFKQITKNNNYKIGQRVKSVEMQSIIKHSNLS